MNNTIDKQKLVEWLQSLALNASASYVEKEIQSGAFDIEEDPWKVISEMVQREINHLREAIEEATRLLSLQMSWGDYTTQAYEVLTNALSSHREDAEITNPITQAIRDFMPTTDQQAGYDALVAWLESTTPFTLEDGRDTE